MIPITLAATATAALIVAIALRMRWMRLLVGVMICLMIAYVLLFYSGSIARSVLRPGPPAGTAADSFYLGIRLLQEGLLDSYLVVVYLSLLNLVNLVWRRDLIAGSPHSLEK
jgi:hypothetical protein